MPMQQQGLMGLLSSPVTQGLLAAGLGAMASRGNTMQALGRGGLLGLSTFGQAEGAKQNRLMEMAQEQMRQDVLAKADGGQGLSRQELNILSNDPSKWGAIAQGGRPKLDTVDLGGQVGTIDPFTGQLVAGMDKTPTFGDRMTDANNPVSIAGGQPQLNAQLWNAQQMSANADLNRDIQRAAGTEAIAAQGDLVSVPDGQGGSRMMTRDQAMAFLGGGQAAPQMATAGQMQQAGVAGQAPQGPQPGGLGYTPPPDTSKEDYEFDKKVNADFGRAQGNVNLTDRATVYIDRLLANEAGLNTIMGAVRQNLPDFAMNESAINAKADLDSIKAKVVLDVMESMKAQSATGATGFGNMNKEQLKVIEDAMGSLSRAQTADQVRDNLRIIRNEMQKSRNAAVQDYESAVKRYGDRFDDRYTMGALGELADTTTPQGVLRGDLNQQRPGLDQIFGF